MGSGVSKETITASLAASTDDELKAAVGSLSADMKAKLAAALEAPAEIMCCTLMYDFKEQADRDAWYNNFITSDDGFKETAAAKGIKVQKLYVAADSPTKVGFYEEWDSKENQLAYAKSRAASGFLAKWFDFQIEDVRRSRLSILLCIVVRLVCGST